MLRLLVLTQYFSTAFILQGCVLLSSFVELYIDIDRSPRCIYARVTTVLYLIQFLLSLFIFLVSFSFPHRILSSYSIYLHTSTYIYIHLHTDTSYILFLFLSVPCVSDCKQPCSIVFSLFFNFNPNPLSMGLGLE